MHDNTKPDKDEDDEPPQQKQGLTRQTNDRNQE